MSKKRLGFIIAAAIGVLFLGYGVLRLTMYKYVQPDEVGIWMTDGGQHGISDYHNHTGHFPIDFNPLTKSFTLPAMQWTVDLPAVKVYSKENGEWTVDPSFTFSIDRIQAPLVCWQYNGMLNQVVEKPHEKFMESIGRHILAPIVSNAFVETLGSLRDTMMMNEKMLVQRMIEDSVKAGFKRLGFTVNNFVTGITPPAEILATNQSKNNALQAVYKAKADVEQANAQAVVKVALAKADAEAMLVTKRAEAEAAKLQANSLNNLVLQKMWIEHWDGKLPTVLSPTASSFVGGLPTAPSKQQ